MGKRLTKKTLVEKWQIKIKKSKSVYDEVKKKNPELKSFYRSEGYLDFKKRKERSLKRYDKRDEINLRKRERYVFIKSIDKKTENVKQVDSLTIFDAFSGRGRIVETVLIDKAKEKQFFGVVQVGETDSTEKGTFRFDNYADFRLKINKILSVFYSLGSEQIFKITVDRSFEENENEIFIKYHFYDEQIEENE